MTTGSTVPVRSGLRGRDFTLLLLATFGALSNYAPLLSVVPLWAAAGGSGGTGVGATTGVVMGTTVLTQLSMGRLLRLLTLRRMLGLGALLLGAVTPAYALSSALAPVLAVSAVRGVGFAMVVVAGSALVAELIPRQQWGKGAGVYGLAAGLPSVVCLPLGVWVAQEVGFVPVFLAASGLCLLSVPLVLAMSGNRRARPEPVADRPDRRTRVPLRPLGGPWVLLLAAAFALGGVATFLPLALASPGVASAALLTLSVCMIAGRWSAGALGDVLGSGRLLPPAVALAAAGMGGLALGVEYGGTVAMVAAAFYGLGFGAVQNDTLVVMLHRAGAHGHGVASTVWNVAYDAGTGAGAVLLGVLVATAGHTWAFTAAAVAIAATAPAAWLQARR
ncbi:MAG TPA: MFS transporter [Nocardioidaceae bacterium]|nr:MFS transporter [Nocardioidaceae bacterium]